MGRLLFLLVGFFAFQLSGAQTLNAYKYVAIPLKFSAFNKPNQYNMNNYARLLFSQKGIKVIPEDKTYWPKEAYENPCWVTHLDVEKVSNFLKNELKVTLLDCDNHIWVEKQGDSRTKEYAVGYKEAFLAAFNQLDWKNYSFQPENKKEEKREVEETYTAESIEEKVKPTPSLTVVEKPEIIDGNTRFYDDKFEYELTSFSEDEVFFQIYGEGNENIGYISGEISTVPNIYHLMINRNNSVTYTIGYFSFDKWIIDVQNEEGQWEKAILKPKK